MLLMVVLRNVIDTETFDYSDLVKVRAPAFTALKWDSSVGNWTTDTSNIQEEMDPFFRYADYPSEGYYENFTDY